MKYYLTQLEKLHCGQQVQDIMQPVNCAMALEWGCKAIEVEPQYGIGPSLGKASPNISFSQDSHSIVATVCRYIDIHYMH